MDSWSFWKLKLYLDTTQRVKQRAVKLSMTEPGNPSAFQRSLKPRAATELLSRYVYRPAAHPVVLILRRLGVAPIVVVAAHTSLGFAAAFAIATKHLVLGAGLIVGKTILDASDGQLARLTGKLTEAGRYADTVGDLLANVAIFLGVAMATRKPLFAGVSFLAMMTILSIDFNVDHLYQRAHFSVPPPKSSNPTSGVKMLKAIYRVILEPQDRAVRKLVATRFVVAFGKAKPKSEAESQSAVELQATRRFHSLPMLRVLANYGLATQHTVLSVCLLIKHPLWFLPYVASGLVLVLLTQFFRERSLRES
jgi:archaetidylinositol phosphate synthase